MSSERDTISRRRLARILAIPESATDSEFQVAAKHLLTVLRKRQERAARPQGEGSHPQSAAARGDAAARESQVADRALELEIIELTSSLERWASRPSAKNARETKVDRSGLIGALLGATLTLALLVAYASGMRVTWQDSSSFVGALDEPATLVLSGRLPGATLRVLDADRDELFAKTPAEGAIVELSPGRYALDVSREDCPDHWTRSVYFEAGATHRFEPTLCIGKGQVTIRSTVTGDRLVIDGFDVGQTSAAPHVLGVGDHEIRIEKPGYQTFESRIRIEPDGELQIRAELVPEQKGSGRPRPQSPLPFEKPDLTSNNDLKPEPFDMSGLQQEIAPQRKAAPRTSLLNREGVPGLPDGGSTAWHDRISAELLTRFDADGSSRIDRLEESEAISCALWLEIERDFERGGLGLSMARYFGFDGSEWHPNALGFAKEMRSAAYHKMQECGLQP